MSKLYRAATQSLPGKGRHRPLLLVPFVIESNMSIETPRCKVVSAIRALLVSIRRWFCISLSHSELSTQWLRYPVKTYPCLPVLKGSLVALSQPTAVEQENFDCVPSLPIELRLDYLSERKRLNYMSSPTGLTRGQHYDWERGA